ncbi:MAG: zinc ribbon domain-containing protein [Deltaproteobacteria bacterium]|nr:zinc ribbon domain-containing protein [Deltaproteobacteria bacterium]MBW1952525.1 zinc ribbon domain-containing protein [Deltaproteobacteria bacterium]MBW1987286.1 zinc ribbon domain-containing protein [Deltaproteobacteria bacterium]MBW2135144.1 zinc ribbon domain-containing protein [Deltaproteobacteria bacterium]
MPIYDFVCPHCGARRDMLLLPGDLGEDILCPACGLGTLIRVVSASELPSERCTGPAGPTKGGHSGDAPEDS